MTTWSQFSYASVPIKTLNLALFEYVEVLAFIVLPKNNFIELEVVRLETI